MTRTLRKLNDSQRVLLTGRDVQRQLDCHLINARIAALRSQKKNNLMAKLIADELDGLVKQITAATK
jgi:hypothetical protein